MNMKDIRDMERMPDPVEINEISDRNARRIELKELRKENARLRKMLAKRSAQHD